MKKTISKDITYVYSGYKLLNYCPSADQQFNRGDTIGNYTYLFTFYDSFLRPNEIIGSFKI